MSALPNTDRPKGTRSVASALPYSQQISDFTALTYEGDLTQTIKLQGIPFATMANADLDARNSVWFANLNSLARDPGIALWTHIVHRQVSYDFSKVEYDNPLSTEFARQYAQKFASERQFITELFLSPVARLGSTKADRWALKLARKESDMLSQMRDQARERIAGVTDRLLAALKPYHPGLLGTYEHGGALCSELAQFYARLLSTSSRHIRLQHAELSHQLQVAGLEFGRETVEIQGPGGSRFAAVLGLVAPYTVEAVDCKVFEGFISAPFEFVACQSLTFMPTHQALKMLKVQHNSIKSTSKNTDQLREIETAVTNLQNGKFAYCNHEWLMVIYANSVAELNQNVHKAVSMLDDKSITTARITGGALIDAYYGIFPANFRHGQKRAMPISSDNFAKFFPMHNASIGNAQGSQWGMPIALLRSDANGPYFLNYHVSRNSLLEQGVQLEWEPDADEAADDRSRTPKQHRREIGHYRIIGDSGAGKTVVKLALRVLARKKNVAGRKPLKTFTFDMHRGEELAVRFMGGAYHRMEAGVDSGANFYSLPNTGQSHSLQFMISAWCAQQGGMFHMTPADEQLLYNAIRNVYDLDPPDRRFARIRDNLPAGGKLHASLGRWCDGGAFAWVLDSPADKFDFDGHNDFGFDITSFVDIEQARTPLLIYLFHKMSANAWGSPHIVDMAEAWKALSDPLMQKFIEDMARTLRRKDGIIGLDTQGPAELAGPHISPTLLSLFPTQIILPNPKATAEQYIGNLGLTPRELHLVQTMPPNSGRFLIKKGVESTVVRLDLTGMEDMLAVLSTSQENLELLDELMRQFGEDPSVLMPEFFKRRV